MANIKGTVSLEGVAKSNSSISIVERAEFSFRWFDNLHHYELFPGSGLVNYNRGIVDELVQGIHYHTVPGGTAKSWDVYSYLLEIHTTNLPTGTSVSITAEVSSQSSNNTGVITVNQITNVTDSNGVVKAYVKFKNHPDAIYRPYYARFTATASNDTSTTDPIIVVWSPDATRRHQQLYGTESQGARGYASILEYYLPFNTYADVFIGGSGGGGGGSIYGHTSDHWETSGTTGTSANLYVSTFDGGFNGSNFAVAGGGGPGLRQDYDGNKYQTDRGGAGGIVTINNPLNVLSRPYIVKLEVIGSANGNVGGSVINDQNGGAFVYDDPIGNIYKPGYGGGGGDQSGTNKSGYGGGGGSGGYAHLRIMYQYNLNTPTWDIPIPPLRFRIPKHSTLVGGTGGKGKWNGWNGGRGISAIRAYGDLVY